MENSKQKKYQFTSYFCSVFNERTGVELTEDNKAFIMSVVNTCEPHKKIDNKGRPSEYFTFRIEGVLITIVCDGNTHKIITVIKETHLERFKNLL